MSPSHRHWMPVLAVLVTLAMVLGCSLPQRLLGDAVGGAPTAEIPGGEAPPPAADVPPPEPLVVTHQGDVFQVYALDGGLRETRPAAGLDYARPNTAQVVGESIYYVDSSGSSLGGVVRRVTSAGVETLDFTAAEDQATQTFAVSEDESRIAWTHSSFGVGVFSQLWIANIDGSDSQVAVQSDPASGLAEYFALETVRWMDGGDLIYAWQVTGIGGYILFFGWSSFYRYSPADGASTLPKTTAAHAGMASRRTEPLRPAAVARMGCVSASWPAAQTPDSRSCRIKGSRVRLPTRPPVNSSPIRLPAATPKTRRVRYFYGGAGASRRRSSPRTPRLLRASPVGR